MGADRPRTAGLTLHWVILDPFLPIAKAAAMSSTHRDLIMLRLILTCLLFLLQAKLDAADFTPLRFDGKVERIYVKEQLYYLNNTENPETFEKILTGAMDQRFLVNPSWGLPLGYPKKPQQGDFWLAMRLDNLRSLDIALLVYGSGTPSLSRIFVLDSKDNSLQRTVNFEQKLARAPRTLAIPPGSWKIYIELKRDVYSYPKIFLGVRSYENLVHHSPDRYFIAISLGICISLLFYNLVLALSLRSKSHYLYVAYNLAIVLYFEANSHLMAEQFGTPELPFWSYIFINTSCVFFFMLFLYHLLEVAEKLPQWKKIFAFFLSTWPLIIVIGLFDHPTATRLVYVAVILAVPLSFALGIHAALRRIPVARALLATMVLPPLGTLVAFLNDPLSEWLPIPLIACAQPLGFNLEMIFLSLTVGYKIRQQQLSLLRKRDHAYSELKKIVYPHQVQQIWEGQTLDRTMPIGIKEAYCLVFDVIGSSKLPVSDPRQFLSSVFHECSALMMQRYDGLLLVANAYRVKEMGDGFLCTIGFPFASPEAKEADHSLRLAFEFMRIFQQKAARIHTDVPMHCAVGIARGSVEAYYPESGAQVYDLFGRGIILATRYESFRDLIFPEINAKDSIIVLQKAVYDQLSHDFRKDFIELALDGKRLFVRDDESARLLYYRLGEAPLHNAEAA